MADNSGINFRFRRNDTVGTADAESDDRYLSDCYVETGDLDALQDMNNPKRIIVGRTGAGKSALIRKLREVQENVIELPPQNLSLAYIANSDILNFFEAAGVNLDLFYQLLWKHVLAVELLKNKYKIRNEEQKKGFLANLFTSIKRDQSKEQAIAYLKEWGEKFWDETEYRVKELTTKVESDLKASLGTDMYGVKFDLAGGRKLTEEQRQEVIQRGRKVVNQIQIKALSDVIRVLSEDVFNDPQQRYFITIDGLDEHWVEDSLRYKLIRALIETVRAFQKIKYVKIVISLRVDLLGRVITATRDSGFQEEKYESLYLKLRWSKSQIEEMLDRRIGKLVSERYTSRPVKLRELFPKSVGKSSFIDYLVERTFFRPRDAILFVNACLEQAEDRNCVTAKFVSDAESGYSSKRLTSLQEEWGATFPNLTRYTRVLQRRTVSFKLNVISKEVIEDLIYNEFSNDLESSDPIVAAAIDLIMNGKGTPHSVTQSLFQIFYTVGLVGIKPDSTSGTFWSYHTSEAPSSGAVKPSSTAHIHPTFWRTLGAKVTEF
jgi:DNA replication initiation complex subunit (GINS family)